MRHLAATHSTGRRCDPSVRLLKLKCASLRWPSILTAHASSVIDGSSATTTIAAAATRTVVQSVLRAVYAVETADMLARKKEVISTHESQPSLNKDIRDGVSFT